MAVKLYVHAMSQPCRSVMLFLECTDVPHENIIVNPRKGETQTEEFLKKNPNGQIPTMEDADGFCLFESGVILKYLCETRDVPGHWYPKDVKARAKIDEYLSWHHTNLRLGAAVTVHKLFMCPKLYGQPADIEGAEESKKKFVKCMKVLDGYFLADSKFISSNEISIADLMAVTEFSQLELIGSEAPPISEKVKEWLERCKETTMPHYNDVHKVMYDIKARFSET